MIADINSILKKLELPSTGKYENQFYIVDLIDSNDYARVYTLLDKNAINTEYPSIENKTNGTTTKIINYFELEDANITYNIFLIANFEEDSYKIKIGEK